MLILYIHTVFDEIDICIYVYIYIDNMMDVDDAHSYIFPYVMQLSTPRRHSYST